MHLPTFSVVGIYCFLEIPGSFDPRRHSVEDLLKALKNKGLNHVLSSDHLSLSYRYTNDSNRPDFASQSIRDGERSLDAKLGNHVEGDCVKWNLEITAVTDVGEIAFDFPLRSTTEEILKTPIRELHTDNGYTKALDQNRYRIILRAVHYPAGYRQMVAQQLGSNQKNKYSCISFDGFSRFCYAVPRSPEQFPSGSSIAVLLDTTSSFKPKHFQSFEWTRSGNRIRSITLDGEKIENTKNLNGSGYSVVWQFYRYCLFPDLKLQSVRLYTPGSYGLEAQVDAFHKISGRKPKSSPVGHENSFEVFLRPIVLNLDPATRARLFQDQT